MKAVVSVIGKDAMGLLAQVAKTCADVNANVVDVTQTVLQDMFAMIMLVDITDLSLPLKDFAKIMEEKGKEQGLVIHVMHEDIFQAMHRI